MAPSARQPLGCRWQITAVTRRPALYGLTGTLRPSLDYHSFAQAVCARHLGLSCDCPVFTAYQHVFQVMESVFQADSSLVQTVCSKSIVPNDPADSHHGPNAMLLAV